MQILRFYLGRQISWSMTIGHGCLAVFYLSAPWEPKVQRSLLKKAMSELNPTLKYIRDDIQFMAIHASNSVAATYNNNSIVLVNPILLPPIWAVFRVL